MVFAKKKESFLNKLLLAGILVFLVLIGITNLFHYNYPQNPDIASDAVLGRLIWESKELIPDTWYIAEETRLICMPDIAALFYGLTHNMTLSAGLACCMMTLLILGSIFYFGRMLHFQKKEILLFVFLCLVLQTDSALLELSYLFASYYAVHIVFLFFTFGIYLEASRDKTLKWPKLAVGLFFSLVFGMQGARGILVIYGPLFGMEILLSLYDIYCGRKKEKPDIVISLWVAALLAVGFLGMFFPISIGQEFSRNIRNGFYKLCTEVVPDVLNAAGFRSSQPVAGKICAAVLFLVLTYLLIDIAYRMCKRKEIDTAERGFLLLCSSPIVTAFMVAFTTVESTERYYFLLRFVMAYGAVLFFRKVKEDETLQNRLRSSLIFIIIVYSIVCFYHVYLPVLRAEEPPRGDSADVVRFLEENDFQMAYSTFENANTMTVISNGNIRIAAVDSVEKMDICKWMSSTDWYVPNVPYEERTAYVIPDKQMEEFERFLAVNGDDIKFETQIGRFFIYSSDYNFSCLP